MPDPTLPQINPQDVVAQAIVEAPGDTELFHARVRQEIARTVLQREIQITSVPRGAAETAEEAFEPDFEGLFNILEGHKDALTDPVKRLSALQQAKPEDLVRGLAIVHSFLAPKEVQSPNDKTATAVTKKNNQSGALALYIEPSERADFMSLTSQKLKAATTVEQAADIIGYATVLTHTFQVGNSSTARLLQTLIANGYDGSDQAKQQLRESSQPRDNQGSARTVSFEINDTVAQTVINEQIPADKQAHLRERIQAVAGFKEKFDQVFLSKKMLGFSLDGIKDLDIRDKLIKVLQQSDFGIAAVEKNTNITTEAVEGLPTADFMMRLAQLDNESAQEVISSDAAMRQIFFAKVLDMASGASAQTSATSASVQQTAISQEASMQLTQDQVAIAA